MARHAKKIDFTFWQVGNGASLALSAGNIGELLVSAEQVPKTLLRIRGSFFGGMDGSRTGGELVSLTAGIIAVPEGTGTTVLWSPDIDGDAPWIWRHDMLLNYEEPVTDVIGTPRALWDRVAIDSKAMRILRNQELQLVMENVTIGSAAQTNSAVGCRFLFGR